MGRGPEVSSRAWPEPELEIACMDAEELIFILKVRDSRTEHSRHCGEGTGRKQGSLGHSHYQQGVEAALGRGTLGLLWPHDSTCPRLPCFRFNFTKE